MSSEKDENFERFYASATQSQIKAMVYAAWNDGNAPQKIAAAKTVLELKGGRYYVHPNGDVYEGMSQGASRTAGLERASRDLAVKAAKKRLERDRLAAWAVERSGVEYEWVQGLKNCYLYTAADGRYAIGVDRYTQDAGKTYMPLDTATWICEKLNAGGIVL